jgi:hypothetical protein
MNRICVPAILALSLAFAAHSAQLPRRYFLLLEAGTHQVDARLGRQPGVTLAEIETQPEWRHFGYSILAPAVLYAKRHSANHHYHERAMLDLAMRIGDLLASENEKGTFTPRLDSDWDTYTWLEAYRLLRDNLGESRRERWKRALLANVEIYEQGARERVDFPWYQSPYIGTSPNHYAQWAELLFLAGREFDVPKWSDLGGRILHRFAATEQTADGFWGEHSNSGPTIGYDHLTLSAVALYAEYSNDPSLLRALRKSLTFHENFTYPDGTPVETMNNRNRYWGVSAWSQFGFSHFADGRRYAEFLASKFKPDALKMDELGRLAQDALYYHEGPTAAIPQERHEYMAQLNVPGSIRKKGPWIVSLSGIIETQAVTNQFYLDRQANLSVFHSQLGLIVSGANSKRQPELATFRERLKTGESATMPVSSRLTMSDAGDRLSVAFNSFFSDLWVAPVTDRGVNFRFEITRKGRPPEEAFLTLQLVLHPGEALQTANRKIVLSSEPVHLEPGDIGGILRHHGWKMQVDSDAQLVWPVYPYNPYQAAPETTLEHPVAALLVALKRDPKGSGSVRPKQQEMVFGLSAE